jgi:hypothetical protein
MTRMGWTRDDKSLNFTFRMPGKVKRGVKKLTCDPDEFWR